VIAMSGAFSGNEVHSGVAADAFYQKGSSMGSLLRMMETLPRPERMPANHPAVLQPLWVHLNQQENSGVAHVTIACPECLRTFAHPLGNARGLIRETECIYCRASIQYAIDQAAGWEQERASRRPSRKGRPFGLPQLYS